MTTAQASDLLHAVLRIAAALEAIVAHHAPPHKAEIECTCHRAAGLVCASCLHD